MIKIKLFITTLFISLCAASQGISENLKMQRLLPHTSITRDGLYEIISPLTGNVIYIYSVNGQPTQIHAIPSGLTSERQQLPSEQRGSHN